jgi:hypothetical protein
MSASAGKPRRNRKREAAKGNRVEIHLQPAEKTVIARAAELRRTTLSNFMLEGSLRGRPASAGGPGRVRLACTQVEGVL